MNKLGMYSVCCSDSYYSENKIDLRELIYIFIYCRDKSSACTGVGSSMRRRSPPHDGLYKIASGKKYRGIPSLKS